MRRPSPPRDGAARIDGDNDGGLRLAPGLRPIGRLRLGRKLKGEDSALLRREVELQPEGSRHGQGASERKARARAEDQPALLEGDLARGDGPRGEARRLEPGGEVEVGPVFSQAGSRIERRKSLTDCRR